MSTASTGWPSCVWKSVFTVPSREEASWTTSSVENGTSSASARRRRTGRLVIASYPPAPRAVHSQTWRARKRGSPRSASAVSSATTSTRAPPPRSVGREHRVEDRHDPAALGDEREPLVEGQPFDLEGRQVERAGQLEPLVGDDRERHPVPFRELDLVGEALRGEAGDARAEGRELGRVVAEAARLRRAAARARDVVPAGKHRPARLAGA